MKENWVPEGVEVFPVWDSRDGSSDSRDWSSIWREAWVGWVVRDEDVDEARAETLVALGGVGTGIVACGVLTPPPTPITLVGFATVTVRESEVATLLSRSVVEAVRV